MSRASHQPGVSWCSYVAAQVRLICKVALIPLYAGAGFQMVGPSDVVGAGWKVEARLTVPVRV